MNIRYIMRLCIDLFKSVETFEKKYVYQIRDLKEKPANIQDKSLSKLVPVFDEICKRKNIQFLHPTDKVGYRDFFKAQAINKNIAIDYLVLVTAVKTCTSVTSTDIWDKYLELTKPKKTQSQIDNEKLQEQFEKDQVAYDEVMRTFEIISKYICPDTLKISEKFFIETEDFIEKAAGFGYQSFISNASDHFKNQIKEKLKELA